MRCQAAESTDSSKRRIYHGKNALSKSRPAGGGAGSGSDVPHDPEPTALYSFEEYKAGAEMLYQTVMLRAESVKGQIDGAIPATDEEQRADTTELVDASEIDISVMGVMDMGGGERKSARAAKRQ